MATAQDLSTDLADIPVGKYLGERVVQVTSDLVERFAAGSQDPNPWYVSSNPFGGPVAPALIGSHEPWRFPGWYPPEVRGALHSRQEWDLFEPIPIGGTYHCRAFVAERYLRRDRHLIVNEIVLADPGGRPFARGRTHMSFLRDQPQGFVVDRERERRSDRRIEPGGGAVLESVAGEDHLMTPEACLAAADGKDNYHSNPVIARDWGFPAVVVQGVFNANLVSALLSRRFGTGWWRGGRLAMSFVNVIWGGDTVTPHLAVREIVEESPGRRAICEVWVAKPDGIVTAIGTASAMLGQSVQA
ncbi:MAG: hypothetical protein NVS9B1_23640 [Candidatus Dormibacteraceae bacterium]